MRVVFRFKGVEGVGREISVRVLGVFEYFIASLLSELVFDELLTLFVDWQIQQVFAVGLELALHVVDDLLVGPFLDFPLLGSHIFLVAIVVIFNFRPFFDMTIVLEMVQTAIYYA